MPSVVFMTPADAPSLPVTARWAVSRVLPLGAFLAGIAACASGADDGSATTLFTSASGGSGVTTTPATSGGTTGGVTDTDTAGFASTEASGATTTATDASGGTQTSAATTGTTATTDATASDTSVTSTTTGTTGDPATGTTTTGAGTASSTTGGSTDPTATTGGTTADPSTTGTTGGTTDPSTGTTSAATTSSSTTDPTTAGTTDTSGGMGCVPTGCTTDLAPNARTCSSAKTVGRRDALLASGGFVGSGDTTGDGANSNDVCPNGAWDFSTDNFWQIYLYAGDELETRMRFNDSGLGETVKIARGCGGSDVVACGEYGVTTRYVATADGWHVVIADGRTAPGVFDDFGPYTVDVILRPGPNDCPCP